MEKCTKEFDELVAERCNQILEECEEYLKEEFAGKMSEDELRVMAEGVIYKRTVKDTIELLKYFQII